MDHLLENVIKYGLLIATAPIWWPVLRALWNELQASMWREGGLVGRAPTEHEIPMLEKKYMRFASPLLNETKAQYKLREEREEVERQDAKRNRGKRSPGDDSNDVVQPRARSGGRPAPGRGRAGHRPTRTAGGGGGGGRAAASGGFGGGARRKPGF